MSTLKLSELRKSYGRHQALHGISLDISDGEFVALVGPSGCGKSTLLRMIAGLESITSGELRIDERIVNDLRPKERDIAMVFQSYALYPQKTVGQNMGYALKLAGMPRAEIDVQVRKVAETLALTLLLDRYPRELSGGQRQRVAMGRAIVRKPNVFLFDEPLSNLDAKLRVQMRSEIKHLHHRLGTTMIYVTHDQVEAMTMADRVVVMHAGRIEQEGAPLELYDRPANVFVAGFLGSPAMNILAGTLMREPGGLVFDCNGLRIPVPEQALPSSVKPGNLIVGIRPEHLRIVECGDCSPHSFRADVSIVEPTGAETLLRTGGGDTQLSVLVFNRATFQPGARISLTVEPEHFHFFDARTEQSLRII